MALSRVEPPARTAQGDAQILNHPERKPESVRGSKRRIFLLRGGIAAGR
jgi:hypothetical protein